MSPAVLRHRLARLEEMRTDVREMLEPLEVKADHALYATDPDGPLTKRERRLYRRLSDAQGNLKDAAHVIRQLLTVEESARVRGVAL